MSDKFWKYARIETEESLKASVLAIVVTAFGQRFRKMTLPNLLN
jgi:hypothetical protein